MSEKGHITFFEKCRKYSINNEKRLKCDDVNNDIIYSRYYINFKIKMRIKNEKAIIILKEVHLIFNLFYNLIININIFLLNNIVI